MYVNIVNPFDWDKARRQQSLIYFLPWYTHGVKNHTFKFKFLNITLILLEEEKTRKKYQAWNHNDHAEGMNGALGHDSALLGYIGPGGDQLGQ